MPCRLSVKLSTSILFSIDGEMSKCPLSSGYRATTSRSSMALNHFSTQAGLPIGARRLRMAVTASGEPRVTKSGTLHPAPRAMAFSIL